MVEEKCGEVWYVLLWKLEQKIQEIGIISYLCTFLGMTKAVTHIESLISFL